MVRLQGPSFLTEFRSSAVSTLEFGELSQHSTYTRCRYNVESPGAWVEGLNVYLVPPQGRQAVYKITTLNLLLKKMLTL